MEAQGIKRLISVTGFGAVESNASISYLQRVPFHLVFGQAYEDKSSWQSSKGLRVSLASNTNIGLLSITIVKIDGSKIVTSMVPPARSRPGGRWLRV
jgi:hypothetical protein